MLKQLGDISVERFLSEYWQQKPLCIRQAIPNYRSPISPEELAGLSLESDIESRLIIEKPARQWQLRHGPFSEKDFKKLPNTHWTLLVQGVDALEPEVSHLLDLFRFLPSWRLDDIMVSYATDQGSVGPHFDHYDVFLLQTQGKRLWQIGEMCDETTPLVDDCDLSILKNFKTQTEWLLEPGDMLYLPPKLAHWGVAQGDCMTYSIGFRAPKTNEMLSSFCDHLLETLANDDYYRDEKISVTTTPGHIDPSILETIQQALLEKLSNKQVFAQWFGEYASTPRYQELQIEDDELPEHHGGFFERVPGLRYLYTTTNNSCLLFIDGNHWEVDLPFAQIICDSPQIPTAEIDANSQALLEEFIELGYLQPSIK